MADKGWIALHRSIRDHWLYQEKRVFSKYEAWLDILMDANHQKNKIVFDGQLFEVERGQRVTSIRQLCERWSWSNSKVNRFLKMLEDDGMIIKKSDSKKTVITIANYDVYQSPENEKATAKRQQSDTEATQKHTNNNDNNDKQLNNEVVGGDTQSEIYQTYESIFGMLNPITMQNLDYWCDDLSPELVKEALVISAKGKAQNFKYTETILRRWEKAGVKNLNDVAELDRKRGSGNQVHKKPSAQRTAPQSNSEVEY